MHGREITGIVYCSWLVARFDCDLNGFDSKETNVYYCFFPELC